VGWDETGGWVAGQSCRPKLRAKKSPDQGRVEVGQIRGMRKKMGDLHSQVKNAWELKQCEPTIRVSLRTNSMTEIAVERKFILFMGWISKATS
jgi:hypothetical protein